MFLRLHRACFAPSKTVHLFIFLLPPLPFPTSSFPPPLSSSPAPPFFSKRPTGVANTVFQDGERKRWSERESARARVRKNGVRQKKKNSERGANSVRLLLLLVFGVLFASPSLRKRFFFLERPAFFFFASPFLRNAQAMRTSGRPQKYYVVTLYSKYTRVSLLRIVVSSLYISFVPQYLKKYMRMYYTQ